MTIQINVAEAKARLSELIAAAERGEEVIIARAGLPVVRLAPIATALVRRAGVYREMGWTGAPARFEAFAPEPEHSEDQPLPSAKTQT